MSRSGKTVHTRRNIDRSITFKRFVGTARVVDRASLEVATGELIGIVGETGCGKSVLMRALLDLLPTPPARIEGSVEFDGTDLRRLPPRERRAVPPGPFYTCVTCPGA